VISALKRACLTVAMFAVTLFAVWALAGCSTPKIEYRPIPAMLIPPVPILPKILAAELECLSSPTYFDLATRDRLLRQDNEALRALLRVAP
jgi:hypothetical protein